MSRCPLVRPAGAIALELNGKPAPFDHKHRFDTVRPYEFRNAGVLLEDFWTDVERVLVEEGGT